MGGAANGAGAAPVLPIRPPTADVQHRPGGVPSVVGPCGEFGLRIRARSLGHTDGPMGGPLRAVPTRVPQRP